MFQLPLRGSLAMLAAEDWRTWAPVGSVAIAALSLGIAIANRRTARRALRLSEEQEKRRTARLDLSLNSATVRRHQGAAARSVLVDILAVNPTDRDGSLVSADLHVTYRTGRGDRIVVKIPHRAAADRVQMDSGLLDLPARLPANGAVRGALEFELADQLLEGGLVEQYEVVVADGRGISASLQPWAMKEMGNGAAQE